MAAVVVMMTVRMFSGKGVVGVVTESRTHWKHWGWNMSRIHSSAMRLCWVLAVDRGDG